MARRCPKCFNTYPEWSPGTCPVCSRNERDARRYRTRYKSSSEKYTSAFRSKLPSRKSGGVQKSKHSNRRRTTKMQRFSTIRTYPKAPQPITMRMRVEGFNHLLRDIYQKERRLSHLLIEHGVSQRQIERLVKDQVRLCYYLERIEKQLVSLVRKRLPKKYHLVIFMCYGISHNPPLSFQTIANQLGISKSQAKKSKQAYIEFFRSSSGKASFEEIVIDALRS